MWEILIVSILGNFIGFDTYILDYDWLRRSVIGRDRIGFGHVIESVGNSEGFDPRETHRLYIGVNVRSGVVTMEENTKRNNAIGDSKIVLR